MTGMTRMRKMKKMNGTKIVLIGTDNSGKSTLAKNLSSLWGEYKGGLEIVNPLGPKPLSEQLNHMNNCLLQAGNKVIDRLPLFEEEVCGPIFRKESSFKYVPTCYKALYLSQIDYVIFCDPGMEAITNWGSRKQMSGVKENIDKLYQGYQSLISELEVYFGDRLMTYNYTQDNLGIGLRMIYNKIRGGKQK